MDATTREFVRRRAANRCEYWREALRRMENNPAPNEPNALPTEQDFDPWGGFLDAQCAWKNFGGLTLEQANCRFRECPEAYQEDFMFMGGKAFAFYFPVIDGFLRESPHEVGDDRQAWILAKCIKLQFSGQVLPEVGALARQVLDLAHFVKANIDRFDPEPDPRFDVAAAWQELAELIRSVVPI